MTDDLYTLFQQTAAAAWLALVAGVWFFKLKDARQIDRYIGMGCVLISPYLLTCFGVRSVNVAENIEAIAQIQQASPVSVEPLATMASFSISTKGGNHVEFNESGGWSVRGFGGGDYGLSDGGPRSVSDILRRSRRELSSAGFAAPEDAAAGRESLPMQATDAPEASGSWWRSQGCNSIADSDCRDGRVVEQANQPAQGIESGRED
jgi:hypothetical protein